MRDIKFRAFDKEKQIMIYDYQQGLGKHYKHHKLGDSIHSLVWDVGVVFGTLMQLTGQSVKKGVELYEGDVLRFDWLYQDNDKPYSEDSMGILGVIEWRDRFVVSFFGGAMSFDLHEVNQVTFERFWRQDYHSSMMSYFKMVNFRLNGNIHQNPELLENKQ